MKLIVDRFYGTDVVTIGRLLVDTVHVTGEWGTRKETITTRPVFHCFTLEDGYRPVKVAAVTRIPAGRYEIKLRPEGGKYNKYLLKYPWLKPGMLHVTNVPGFEWILIHPGNTTEDTEGCLLVGMGVDIPTGSITHSVAAFKDLYDILLVCFKNNEQVFIEYQDNDR